VYSIPTREVRVTNDSNLNRAPLLASHAASLLGASLTRARMRSSTLLNLLFGASPDFCLRRRRWVAFSAESSAESCFRRRFVGEPSNDDCLRNNRFPGDFPASADDRLRSNRREHPGEPTDAATLRGGKSSFSHKSRCIRASKKAKRQLPQVRMLNRFKRLPRKLTFTATQPAPSLAFPLG